MCYTISFHPPLTDVLDKIVTNNISLLRLVDIILGGKKKQ